MANSSGLYSHYSGVDATLLKINGTQVTATAAEINALDITAAGTVTASKAVVVDSNKDIGDFRNLDAVNVDAGASGTAGTVDIFPSTASKGKIAITAADSAGDTTTTLVNASQAGARTYTIPDAGASASFVMTEGNQTVNGVKTIATCNATILQIGSTTVASTAAEIDKQCDLSAQTETVAAAGACSVTLRVTKLALVGAGAVTLAAPDATMLGMVKLIEMTADNGDVTLALTNVDGQSSGTTATFNDVGDALTLVGGVSKWHVIGEAGITLS